MRPRARRWLKILAALLVAAAIAGWWIDRQLEPTRLVTLVLGQAGKALQLDIRFTGTPAYALRPEPRLLIPALDVRNAGDGSPILSARHAELSLPWATITGDEPVITRIQLDAPTLHVAGLQRWLAARPKAPFKLPTLTQGLRISDGRILGEGFELTDLAITLPQLQTGVPAQANLAGTWHQGGTALTWDAVLEARTPGLASDFALNARGHWQRSPAPLALALDSGGHFDVGDTSTLLQFSRLTFNADSPLPSLSGRAQLQTADRLTLTFDGKLANWPKDWPTLPMPLAENSKALSLHLDYAGANDLSGLLSLHIVRDGTEADAQLRLPQLQTWIDAPPGSPLPPLDAQVRTPTLDVAGATIEGLEVELHASSPADKQP